MLLSTTYKDRTEVGGRSGIENSKDAFYLTIGIKQKIFSLEFYYQSTTYLNTILF